MKPRKAAAPAPTERKSVRCAVYTRKSTEEGLEQEFNSLDAQRESAEAYITSQKAEGWQCLPDRYDDGGFSGGSLERPALKALIKDIEAGKIDCVVVYKVDRLSRSLMDFSRIVEVFERQKVSFVSVTQAFNTRDSMGRLMLNVLLSFAQFEREIIGERIRDKISMQRRRGKWTGGKAVLGYDVDRTAASPKLVVNEEEAQRVREVYALYLKLGSLMPLMDEVARRGWTTKRIRTRKGAQTGGAPLSRNALHAMLTNRIYLGKISHRQECFEGEHPAIVDHAAFDAVQAKLQANGRAGGNDFRNRYHALLKRILRCRHCGCAMTHVFHGTERKRSLWSEQPWGCLR